MKILLFGGNGQLGSELRCTLPKFGTVDVCTRNEVDLTNGKAIRDRISSFCPDVIVNAAAYTAVDKAESERELAFFINSDAVAILADEARKKNIWLIHYSTDYVFDGMKKGSYTELDVTNPVNIYGKSKLAGEFSILSCGCKHLIFRTTWVIGKNGKNFVKTILRLSKERSSLNVVDDQYGVPTSTSLIAKVTGAAIEGISGLKPWPKGIYHLAPYGKTTWFGVAQTLLEYAKQQDFMYKSVLNPIPTTSYITPAKRPLNSLLNTNNLEQKLKFNFPHWKSDFLKIATDIIKDFESL